ncbi:hypothetical protein VARV_IND64_vel4_168 [Variola virus]|uniref:Protein OPG181 n=3 Tax=Variola virus TaxID=10255 RepID=PG181_VAR67|nr:hypothetical protein VARVgp163 [Variola virus]P0DSU3.1 RecName: Full=Protein OPG181 [Variola virus human/India/Ind3/1967]P0DSU4.1 RecName: Full=Protein OPG181 [Variola virus]AAA60906.1 homolog of vaccinia virus CDS A51R; putative [Variola major virus]CAB54764.1 K5R protein [Variola minor virus]ABF22927.1 hypothetical protein VARV_BEN68_59_168 [Variola virus]ABF23130.1 hypothetical protein VARV_BOT72_143_168 [Variola virus]ABF23332.1 hypothetical protein VARV_BOT73_225_168 [Variola virus]
MDGVIVYCLNALVKHGEEINHIKNDFMIKPCCERVCEKVKNVHIDGQSKNNTVIADLPYLDNAVLDVCKSVYKKNVSRISRFANLIKIDDDDKTPTGVYNYFKPKDAISVIISIGKDKDVCELLIASDKACACIELNSYKVAILPMNVSFFTKGNASLIILLFDFSINAAPLLRSVTDNNVVISRHKRLHGEIPSSNWFKFYISIKSNYCSILYMVVDGSVMYAIADNKTHTIISKNILDNTTINDECRCCYFEPQIKILDRDEMLNGSSCDMNRHCIMMNLPDIGEFGSSILGKYEPDMIKIALSVAGNLIRNQDYIPGRRGYSYYVYGIASR